MTTSDPLGPAPQRPEFLAPSAMPAARTGSWLRLVSLVLFCVGLAALMKVSWSFLVSTRSPTSSAATAGSGGELPTQQPASFLTQASTLVSPKTEPPVRPLLSDDERKGLEREAAERAAALGIAKSQQRSYLTDAEELKRTLQDWEEEAEHWNVQVLPLLTNEDGRKLAADVNTVDTIRAILDKQRLPATRAAAIRTSLAVDQGRVQALFQKPDERSTPDPAAIATLQSDLQQARQARDELRESRLQIEALLDAARRNGKSAAETLEAVIATRQRAERLASADALRQRRAAAQAQADNDILAAEDQAIRVAGEVKARKIVDAAQGRLDQQKAEEAARLAAAEKQKRLDALQREMPDVERHLKPFITKGYAQPGPNGNTQTAELGPVSLSKLQGLGALKGTREGLMMLWASATANNDREAGGFSPYVGGEFGWQQANKEFLKRAQELLSTYGDLLVEQGRLAP